MMELQVEHLCKRYGENAVLDDISFTARVGVTRLLGPSGIGKTTLLRVLLGPFTGLDAENREAAMRAILRAAETKIVILSTHEELPIPVPCQIIEL